MMTGSGVECKVEAPLPVPLQTRKERMEASHKTRGGVTTNQEEESVAAANGNASLPASTNEKSSLAPAPANHTLLSVSANQIAELSSVSPSKGKHSPSPTNHHTIESVKTNQKAEVASASAYSKPSSLESTNHAAAAPTSDTSV